MARRNKTIQKYEFKKKNDISLLDDSPVDSHLKPIKVGDKNSILELSDSELRVGGTIEASAITVNGAPVQTGDDVGAITALNSATANELVTVGATTTELDAEANLTFDGNDLSIAATGKIYLDGGGNTYISETSGDNLKIYVGGDEVILMVAGVANAVYVKSAELVLNSSQKLLFDGSIAGHTYISQVSDDILDFYVGTDKMLVLDEANDKITMGATNWVAGTVSGDTVTEFSVANSAYAGMILGYRMIGEDAIHTTYTLTTSLAVPDSDMTVRFIAPPSGCVEVMVQIMILATSTRRLCYFGLSDNATYNTIGATYEQHHHTTSSGDDDEVVQHYWTITGLTAGDTYNYWFGAKTSLATQTLAWGGTGATRYPDFIMKVTALPTAVSDFAEYG